MVLHSQGRVSGHIWSRQGGAGMGGSLRGPERGVFEREEACACSRGRGVTEVRATGVIEGAFLFFPFLKKIACETDLINKQPNMQDSPR